MNKTTPYILIMPIVLLGVLFIFGVLNGIVQSFGYIPAFNMTDITFRLL